MAIKKILLIIPQNTSGGAERVMALLANSFADRGIDVTLLNFDSNSDFYPISSKVNWIKMGLEFKAKTKLLKIIEAPVKEWKRYIYIKKQIKEIKPDAVIPFLEMAEVLTIPNCLLSNVPFCLSLRNDYNAYFGYMKLLSRLTYNKAKVIICQTDAVKKTLDQAIKCQNTVVIPNPLDKTAYSLMPPIQAERRKVIINVGRLTPQKNQVLLIRAFARVASEFPDYELQIFGKGELKTHLQTLIHELGMDSQIRLMGVVNNVLKENKDVSLFVMSSDFEGFPNTLIEAMANGIPVISTNFGTKAAEQILGKDEEYGRLVPVGDEERLSQAIYYALTHPEEMELKATKGTYVRDRFSLETIVTQWINSIEQNIQ